MGDLKPPLKAQLKRLQACLLLSEMRADTKQTVEQRRAPAAQHTQHHAAAGVRTQVVQQIR